MMLEQSHAAAERIEQLEAALHAIIKAGEEFIDGEGSQVEVDLDYCQALSALECAIEQSKRALPAAPGLAANSDIFAQLRPARTAHQAHTGAFPHQSR